MDRITLPPDFLSRELACDIHNIVEGNRIGAKVFVRELKRSIPKKTIPHMYKVQRERKMKLSPHNREFLILEIEALRHNIKESFIIGAAGYIKSAKRDLKRLSSEVLVNLKIGSAEYCRWSALLERKCQSSSSSTEL